MEINRQISSDGATSSTDGAEAGGSLSPDLVRQIADKVYAMLLEDLRIEKERRQLDLIGWN